MLVNQNELTYIKVPYPSRAKDLHFKIIAPVCALVIAPGLSSVWATGKIHDPKLVASPSIKQSGNVAEITALGPFAYVVPPKFTPQMRLSFGRTKPFALSIVAGGIRDDLNFSGLPLTSLNIEYGAGDPMIDFSSPNPQEMGRMKVRAGAGTVQIENLANANTAKIRLDGDSTHYQVNFRAELRCSTSLNIGMTISKVAICIPSGTAIKIKAGGAPHSSQPNDFMHVDKAYLNGPARDHEEPLLSINNTASSGSLYIQYI